jgi:hypothetical protein
MALAPEEIARVAKAALPNAEPGRLGLIVATAMHESSSNPTAEGPTDRNGNVPTGLWQIKHKLHAGKGGGPTDPQAYRQWLKTPLNNAKAMAVISSNGTNLSPWESYTSGRYQQYLAEANAAVESITGEDITGADATPSGGVADAFLDIPGDVAGWIGEATGLDAVGRGLAALGGYLASATRWITNRDNIVRVVYVGGGLALGITALSIVAKPVVADVAMTVKPI